MPLNIYLNKSVNIDKYFNSIFLRPIRDHMKNYEFFVKYPFYSKYPIYIFHHVPKCGGESFGKALNNWFLRLSSNYNSYLNKSTSSATVYTFVNQANNNFCDCRANNKP